MSDHTQFDFDSFRTAEALELGATLHRRLEGDGDALTSDEVIVVGAADFITVIRCGSTVILAGMVAQGAVDYGTVKAAKATVADIAGTVLEPEVEKHTAADYAAVMQDAATE